ncbi:MULTISPECIES: helix-turn-helix transcriptional regulator [Glycomyces]|uniref:Helix-turn-helix transcriptional regulator n=2 Tax=Glycomyces TaxID=58113 RepID=A0A9X3SYJ2_9ACTN|nr:helix-turn-helix transcriptional regulator [Glycomyces lechevalierae]MDA1386356.1 helix-turn-helix transcriptional regulator [Glycomyces lechevalierae]MDR7338871.1 transcriptional regulator with XRE-family HTH domain [Glycomyces lechevalierae]
MPLFTEPVDVAEDIRAYQSNVATFRIEKGWTTEELARAVKVSAAHIHNLEAGRSAGSVHLLFKLARALRCGLDDLVSPTEESE